MYIIFITILSISLRQNPYIRWTADFDISTEDLLGQNVISWKSTFIKFDIESAVCIRVSACTSLNPISNVPPVDFKTSWNRLNNNKVVSLWVLDWLNLHDFFTTVILYQVLMSNSYIFQRWGLMHFYIFYTKFYLNFPNQILKYNCISRWWKFVLNICLFFHFFIDIS